MERWDVWIPVAIIAGLAVFVLYSCMIVAGRESRKEERRHGKR